jgi:hypothetical protein
MAVAIINRPVCCVCGRVKGETNRWFLLKITGPEFRYRDYDADSLSEYDEAVCGMECLDKCHHEHAARLIGMRVAGQPVGWRPFKESVVRA